MNQLVNMDKLINQAILQYVKKDGLVSGLYIKAWKIFFESEEVENSPNMSDEFIIYKC